MAYRHDLAALSARYDALADEVTQKTRELEASRHLLEQARARAKLPVLDNLRVATPCTADWNKMTGDDRARHCGDCQKTVYNFSGMTRKEAEALVIEKNGDLCAHYYQRHDGTILFGDCALDSSRRRRRWVAAGAATLLASGAAAIGVRALHQDLERLIPTPTQEYRHTLGIVVPSTMVQPISNPPGPHGEIKDTFAPRAPVTHAPAHGKPGKPGHVP